MQVCEFFQVVCRYLSDHLLTPALRCADILLPKPASNAARAALREMKGGGEHQLPPRVSVNSASRRAREGLMVQGDTCGSEMVVGRCWVERLMVGGGLLACHVLGWVGLGRVGLC